MWLNHKFSDCKSILGIKKTYNMDDDAVDDGDDTKILLHFICVLWVGKRLYITV